MTEQAVTQQSQGISHGPISFSPTMGKLALALSKAQGQIKPAIKDSINPHFRSKYANLAGIWEACREQLAKNEIAVVQSPSTVGSTVRVTTMLVHSSSEWIMGEVSARAKDESPQSVGSATTYLRRYGLDAMVGISSDEDDDGNYAQPEAPKTPARRAPPPKDPAELKKGAMEAAAAAGVAAARQITNPESSPIYNNEDPERRKRLENILSNWTPKVPRDHFDAIAKRLNGRPTTDLKSVIDEVIA